MSAFEEIISAAVAPGPNRKLAGATFYAASHAGTVYFKNFGTTTVEPDAPLLTEDGIMQLQSCTKLVTSIAALQLVERGLLALDADAAELLPQLKGIEVIIGTEDDGMPILKLAQEKVTLRRLLTHTSGFNYSGLDPRIFAWQESQRLDPASSRGVLPNMITMPLEFEPGNGWNYGVSLGWVGLLVEAASGLMLLEYFQKYIFDPLGLKDFCFNLDKRPDLEARFVKQTFREESGELQTRYSSYPRNAPSEYGGGGLMGSAREYFKIVVAVLNKDQRLLKKETYDSMDESQVSDPQGPMKINDILKGFHQSAPMPDSEIKWGHGLACAVLESDGGNWLRKGTLHWGGMFNNKWVNNHKILCKFKC